MTADDEAIEGLTRLGLSEYEAAVFVGLHKLGTGSASDVAEVTDVPRSGVYGAADGLEELGLIDVQEGTPTVYRPIPVSEARDLLYDRLESTADTAFEYVEEVAGQRAAADERSEAIWRTDGPTNVATRAVQLIHEADERVVYGAGSPDRLGESVVDALAGAVDRGVTVRVVSADGDVLDAVADAVGESDAGGDDATSAERSTFETKAVDESATPDLSHGRLVVVDRDTVLVSVLPTGTMPDVAHETAFWSSETAFATILVTLVSEWFEENLCDDGSASPLAN